MPIKKALTAETLSTVQIARMDRATAGWWNARKSPDDIGVYCGWYWIHEGDENGPFNTRSAALRDAYYRWVLGRETPSIADSVRDRLEGTGAIGLRAQQKRRRRA